MNDREAMKMALELLKRLSSDLWMGNRPDKVDRTILALEVALAQPECEWVGLTDETLDDVYFCVEGGTTPLETWREQARAIEAKLKEKNGG